MPTSLRLPHRALLLLALFSLASSCATTVVSADPYSGMEVYGKRRLRLYMDRVRIYERDALPQVCFECGEEDNASNPAAFKLPFVATNESAEPWLIRGTMFELRRTDEIEDGSLRYDPRLDHSQVVAHIAAKSSARFSVVISLVGTEGVEKGSDLYGAYRLRVNGEDGSVLLERELSVGYFSQLRQLGRFSLFFAGGLLVLGAL